MESIKGTAVKVSERGGIYSVQMDDGNWYGFYKNNPGNIQGKVITFSWEQKGSFRNGNAKTIKIDEAASVSTSSNRSSAASAYDGRQVAIQYQASRNAAIAFVGMALQAGAVVLPTKKQDQLDAIAALVEHYTNIYHISTDAVISNGGVDGNVADAVSPTGDLD